MHVGRNLLGRRRERRHARAAVAALAAVALLAMTLAAACAAAAAPGGRAGDATAVTDDPGDRVGGETPVATPEATPTYVADDLETLHREHGEAPDATFARLRIPVIGVDAGVSPRLVGDVMPVPDGPGNVAWYDMAGHPGMGGAPGEGRNAIFGAHVDFNNDIAYAGIHYRGPGVFYSLHLLAPGDVIEVDYGGETLRYAVAWSRQLDAATTDWGAIWSDAVERESITLYTCGGDFDRESRSYSHRLVVRAERI